MRTITNIITVRQLLRLAACTFIGLSMAACAGDDAAQGEQQGSNEDKNPVGTTIFSSVDQSDESAPSTRTAIVDHIKGGGAKVNWSATDKVWAKDDNGAWQQSGTAELSSTGDLSKADFAFTGTYTGATHEVLYTNMPISGIQPQVEIKAEQTQTAPNNFDHAGESGDFGIATATQKGGGVYKFTLNHKASYICLIPRSANPSINRSKLTKIEIIAENDIAGIYDIAADGTLSLASGGSKSITLTTGSSGFDVNSISYAVIAPGTHKLVIRYWLSNATDGLDLSGNPTPIEGCITKCVNLTFEPGKIHDLTANLDTRAYPGNNYYMWDAQQQHWYGHEWDKTGYVAGTDQPTVHGNNGSAYPKSKTADPSRWYNETYNGYGVETSARQNTLFTSLPNANELSWYVVKGDPRWDNDELWTTMGHIYKGGIWLKKIAKIAADNGISPTYMKTKAADNSTDLRTTGYSFTSTPTNISTNPISAADQANYFYLPAWGHYDLNTLYYVGNFGFYWSSSAYPDDSGYAYSLNFSSANMLVFYNYRSYGFSVVPFE